MQRSPKQSEPRRLLQGHDNRTSMTYVVIFVPYSGHLVAAPTPPTEHVIEKVPSLLSALNEFELELTHREESATRHHRGAGIAQRHEGRDLRWRLHSLEASSLFIAERDLIVLPKAYSVPPMVSALTIRARICGSILLRPCKRYPIQKRSRLYHGPQDHETKKGLKKCRKAWEKWI